MDCYSSEGHADRVLALSVTQRALGMIPGHSNIFVNLGFFWEVVGKVDISLAQKLHAY